MRIVFAIPGLGFGGAERVVSILASQLVKDNHDVKIILTSGNKKIAYDLSQNVEIDFLPPKINVLKRWLLFRKKCLEYKAEAIIAFMDTVGVMAACFMMHSGIPVITSERNDPTEKSRKLSFTFKALKAISVFLTKGYVFQSEGARNSYPKVCQRKSTIILNPIEDDCIPNRDNNEIELSIVNVGRLHNQKNQAMLISAFANSLFCKNGYVLHIYGDGELKTKLQSQVFNLGIEKKVILEGNQKDVLEKIKNASLFVLTSNYEGLPNALMEAMAIGIPCISTDCSPGGARMLINSNNSNGIIVPCENAEKLTTAMDYLYTHRDIMKSMGEKGKYIKEKANVVSITAQWVEFINKVIAE